MAKDVKGKLRLDYLPPMVWEEIAKVRMFGVEKYGNPDNYRDVPVDEYLAAAFRHVNKYRLGERDDKESGLMHLSHAIVDLILALDNDMSIHPATKKVRKGWEEEAKKMKSEEDAEALQHLANKVKTAAKDAKVADPDHAEIHVIKPKVLCAKLKEDNPNPEHEARIQRLLKKDMVKVNKKKKSTVNQEVLKAAEILIKHSLEKELFGEDSDDE